MNKKIGTSNTWKLILMILVSLRFKQEAYKKRE